jgi:cyclopropane fatty-acyl-phospholipid synthase-like methyltransferase
MDNTELDRWNERYGNDGYLFGEEPNAFLRAQAELFAPGQSVLAVADGDGRNSVFLAGLGAEVTAIDFSPIALEKSRLLAAQKGVEVKTDLRDLYEWRAAEAEYDAVVAIFIQFAPPEKRSRLYDNLKTALKPGGLLVMQGYRPKQIDYKTGGPPHAANMYTAELLREAFGDFDISHLEEHDSLVDEGRGHSGMSALIDLIARKPD